MGFLGVAFFSYFFEWAIFMRVMDDPVRGKVASLVAALAVGILLSLMSANPAFGVVSSFICAAILLPYKIWRGMKVREHNADESGDNSDLQDTFS